MVSCTFFSPSKIVLKLALILQPAPGQPDTLARIRLESVDEGLCFSRYTAAAEAICLIFPYFPKLTPPLIDLKALIAEETSMQQNCSTFLFLFSVSE